MAKVGRQKSGGGQVAVMKRVQQGRKEEKGLQSTSSAIKGRGAKGCYAPMRPQRGKRREKRLDILLSSTSRVADVIGKSCSLAPARSREKKREGKKWSSTFLADADELKWTSNHLYPSSSHSTLEGRKEGRPQVPFIISANVLWEGGGHYA